MARLFSYLKLITLLISVAYGAVQTVNGKIKITIGTTSGCSDTVTLLRNLVPTYETYGRFLELEFVPWGRTQINANGDLVCQFGPNDCFANRLHRCALNLLNGNQEKQLHYMSCEFSPPYPAFVQGSLLCAQSVGLNLIALDYCLSTTGDALERPAQEKSQGPMAVINFVPFIVFNDVIDFAQHHQGRNRLNSTICFALAEDPASGVTHCKI